MIFNRGKFATRSIRVAMLLAALAACASTMFASVIPVPIVTFISPVSVAPGGAQFTLTVNGANFENTSVANWQGTPLASTFISSTKLTATVPASLIADSGTGWITVSTPGCAGSCNRTSNVVYLPVVPLVSALNFVGTDYTVGSFDAYVLEGDFNGDGILDLVTANLMGGDVSILLGNGDGTFQAATSIPTGLTQTYGISVGDVNGDGKLDLVVGSDNGGNSSLVVLLGNGDGTFQTPVVIASPQEQLINPMLADLNGDGNLDIIASADNQEAIEIFLGNGDGTFQAPSSIDLSVLGVRPFFIAVGDLNGDGNLDLVVGNDGDDQDTRMALILGNGDGTFQTPTVVNSIGNAPITPVLADLNGDGKLDIAVANYRTSSVTVLLGNGDGTFQTPVDTTVGGEPVGLAFGDLNGDGILDLVTPGASGGNIEVSLGNGDGTFQTPQVFGASSVAYMLVLGNFATAGGLDVAVGSTGTTLTVFQPEVTLSPAPFDFGTIAVGGSFAQTFTVANLTVNAVTISGVSFTGTNPGDFSQTNTCTSPLAAETGTCTISVTFVPGANGSRSATLTVTDGAPNSPQTSSLTGTGISAPLASLSVHSLAFGNQALGATSSSMAVTLTNTGNADLTGLMLTIVGANPADFAETTNCTSTTSSMGSCTISVTFSPAALGSRTASLQLMDNAGDSPQLVTLAGVGVNVPSFSITAAPSSLTIVQGQSGASVLTMTPAGNFTGTLTFSCTALPVGATCAFAPAQIVATGNNAVATTMLTVNTTGRNGRLSQTLPWHFLLPSGGSRGALLSALLFLLLAGLVPFLKLQAMGNGHGHDAAAPYAAIDISKSLRARFHFSSLALLLLFAAAAGAAVIGCSNGPSASATPVGQYSITAEAMATGSTSHSAPVSITVTK